MASYPPAACCTVGFKHEGTPQGKSIRIAGKYDAYLATPPPEKTHKDAAILYLPDIIGVWQNSKLLADEFAANGYLTLLIDTFNGDPVPLQKAHDPAYNIFEWLAHGSNGRNPHTEEAVDPIVEDAIKALKEDYGITKIGSVGYCFGAKYLVRHYTDGIQVGYVAHPSFMDEDELAKLGGPLAIAAAEVDPIFPDERRYKTEKILKKTSQPWQIFFYSGVEHGFAVRCDLNSRVQKFAKEQAFYQAIAWFDHYLLAEV
ncbi:dienelactone hydrolase [Cadophora sp. MPI-SDFR-AT-0126]|nr:dienelactone hydrolase [Leotiomycetes sp. MPI-SDFR-AT-0126]